MGGFELQTLRCLLSESVSQSVFCGTSTYCVLNTVPPIEDDHGNSNSSHVKIFLPKKLLECLPKCSSLPKERHRWNTNEEIAAYLITFEKHEEWLTTSPKTRPQNGSMILYNRKKVKYRKDGYCWKKRKDGKTTREDHMKLKVQGVECLYGCYVHSSIIPTFHRRCYWLLQNPDIVLVHYLNVPAIEDCGKPCGPILCSINTDKKEWAKWTKEELIGQLKPMFHGIKWTCSNGNSSSGFSVEQLVQQILDSHQTKPQPRTHNCLCTGSLGAGSSVHHKCNSAKHRIISPKVEPRTGGYGSHSEVQHNDVSEGKHEHSHSKGSSREKRNGKVAKPVLLHQSSTEVSSTNQVEVPDTTQSSPVSISSGLNSDPDMVDSPVVTGVSSMAVASVMGSLSQSATVFMSEVTNEAVYTMSPTAGPNHHLLSPDASQGLVLAVSSDGHKFAFPTTGSSESLSMLPTNVSEELVLSTTLDGGRKIPETTMNFDPDCFLNNPKQGQTYGGGGLKAEMVSSNIRHSPPGERSFSFTTVLTKEIKTEDTSFEQQMAKEAYSSSAAAAAASSLTLTAGSSLLPSGGGLSPSTTLEQMDFSAIDSNKDYTSSFSQTGHSPHIHQTPSPSFFLQDASKPLPVEQNTHSSLSDSGGTFVMPTVKTEASSQTSSCSGHVETRIESTSSLHLMQFQANFQAMTAEGEVTMETSQAAEGSEVLLKSGELQACSSEHYLQPETNGVIRSAGGVPILPGNVVQGLYPVAQPSLGNASNMELSLDHFDISFSNQFSDLINDFISVEGGSSSIYGHQLVSGDSTALSQSEDGARAPFTQAEMCLPCCSPQQGSLQLSSSEGGAGTMAYMHVAEVVSAASAQGTLGMLQQSGRVFMVTDYSPEWSYPEGGVKVLITGPWQEASNNYSCLFDQISVPASLIQPGVLRCYCPAHDTGLVTLQVAFNNQIISNSVVFEYKARALPTLPSSQHDWLSLDDNQFRMSILERLEQMERRMAEMTGSQQHKQASGGGSSGGGSGSGNGGSQAQCASGTGALGSCFESRVVVVCEKMMSRACWAKSKHLIHSKTFRGMTLLHLAAAQGYATLIQTLIKWRTKHADSIDLELEVDPLNVDHFSCTPLMWACALGHLEAAVVLYKWDRRAISIPDSLGRLPLGIARSRGHVKLAECLEHLQRDEQAQLGQNPRIHCPASEEPSTESWMAQWHSEAISSPEIPKGVTVIASTNPELRRPRSEPSNYYSSESHKDYPAPKKHKLNPEYFQTRQEKLLPTALSLEEPNIRKQSPSSKQSVPETLSPSEGVRDFSRELSPPTPETAAFQASGSQPVGKWNSKDLYIGVSTVQVTGNPKGTSVGKEAAPSQVRPREPMSVLMMANREVVNTELGSYRDSAENEECAQPMDDIQVNMMTLAEHIIEATPDRIKQENFVPMESSGLERTDPATISSTMSWLASYLADADCLPSAAQIRSAYNEPLTPSSNTSLSPVGSPVSEIAFEKPNLPSAADWSEFLSASTSEKVENEFAQLTLSDHEQRELYEAARLVQTAFRKYKGRPLREQQEVAAAVIQRCYRKYKQLTWIALKYALYKKMTQAAILIQSKFRSYYEQKKFQQSRRAAVLIQKYYRSYKKCGKRRQARRTAVIVQQKLRSSLLTKKQDQAARKIMRFLRRCRHSPLVDHRLYKRSERIEKGQGT
ncbi:calmodulin-binding transcription activator 1 isoform X3 [Nomascus leucogenys]|uniref:calmodulin-binding transcription activator 1 isoform X3 n=1 Tax=Nomascus leucogenys TaxID=61853 RepID=UPI00122D6D80|nr:calmodulin-binding transcription activator 1 isoform X3 [Nomascus leucogenys]XP_030661043.1 calmodulin-binding transcription activator 1 isoform X3 [Nomascus leucogenys]XP_055117929.1 calmodulin-binding transcription activator 1 isoform X2 [Symphalangus syndactylus]XP_055117930.1 calmodulin-binding transcription activator 1 isoform X2 [Symphalangus syndactylus]